jgi:hypothetical protein
MGLSTSLRPSPSGAKCCNKQSWVSDCTGKPRNHAHQPQHYPDQLDGALAPTTPSSEMQYAAQNSRWVSPEKARVMHSPLRLLGMMAFQHILNSLPEFRRDQRIVEWILIHSARADLGVIASIWFAPTECGGLRLSAMKGIAWGGPLG